MMTTVAIIVDDLAIAPVTFSSEGTYKIHAVNEYTGYMYYLGSFSVQPKEEIQDSVKMKEQIMEEFDKLMQKIRDWK
jgi:hypothetical protein